MWNWLKDNSDPVSAVATVLMLMVWMSYFQMLLITYRRQRRTKILINRGAGRTIKSQCIISNMGAEPIYIEAVIIDVDGTKGRLVRSLSDLDVEVSPDDDPRSLWFQGPLGTGEFLNVGPFDTLLKKAFRSDGVAPSLNSMKITVAATYTSDDGVAAAEREFTLVSNSGKCVMQPKNWNTRQIRSRRQRRTIKRLLSEDPPD